MTGPPPVIIDFDHASTTPLDPRVRAGMFELLDEPARGNPSSIHSQGRHARGVVEQARRRVAGALGVEPLAVTFTSGGTEADALAVLGTARALRSAGRPSGVLTSPIEHSAVLESVESLRGAGHSCVYVPIDGQGRIRADDLLATLAEHPEVGLVSLSAANHELGNHYPTADWAAGIRELRPDLVVHCDAVQAFGKRPLEFAALGVDLLSISSHKVHGPHGAGALVHRKSAVLAPLWRGGSQERGRRVGTENPLAIHGFGIAASLLATELADRRASIDRLVGRLRGLLSQLDGVCIEGDPDHQAGSIVMATFPDCTGEVLTMALDLEGVCVSTGSACNAGTAAPSKVLLALGHTRERAASAVRFSLGHDNRLEEIDRLGEILPRVVAAARSAGSH